MPLVALDESAARSLARCLMVNSENALTAAALSFMLIVAALLYRRFRRSAAGVPRVCHVAAAVALTVGAVTAMSGVAHSAAVTSLAVNEGVYGPLTILRFTTGAMLVYAGTMSVALYRAIRAGRRWAVGVGTATGLLLWVYLLFLLPLPGTGGTVPPMLGLWSVHVLSLGAAVLAGKRGNDAVHEDAPHRGAP